MGKTEELFKNPTAEYRGKPFWSWNGKLEKSELLRQIEVFRQMGMGGYFCHSRIGLETEYLGNEWFDLINSWKPGFTTRTAGRRVSPEEW